MLTKSPWPPKYVLSGIGVSVNSNVAYIGRSQLKLQISCNPGESDGKDNGK